MGSFPQKRRGERHFLHAGFGARGSEKFLVEVRNPPDFALASRGCFVKKALGGGNQLRVTLFPQGWCPLCSLKMKP